MADAVRCAVERHRHGPCRAVQRQRPRALHGDRPADGRHARQGDRTRESERRRRVLGGVHDPALELAVVLAGVAAHLGEVHGDGDAAHLGAGDRHAARHRARAADRRVALPEQDLLDPVARGRARRATCQVPSTSTPPPARFTVERCSGAGAGPSMKWKYTNGPPTTRATSTRPPTISQRFQWRGRRSALTSSGRWDERSGRVGSARRGRRRGERAAPWPRPSGSRRPCSRPTPTRSRCPPSGSARTGRGSAGPNWVRTPGGRCAP